MKLFDKYEAVKFLQEQRIFITRDGFIYYVYNIKQKYWYRYPHAGYDHITVSNYPDISKEELAETTGGIIPEKETDLMRLCKPQMLYSGHLQRLLEEDYPEYMTVDMVEKTVSWIFHESDAEDHKTYSEMKKLFDEAQSSKLNPEQVLDNLKELSLTVTGRDIFRKEIRIIDGHIGMSYFHIMPARIIDYTNTENWDNVAKMGSTQIAIEEDDVAQYLLPFIEKHFDDDLEANKNRIKNRWTDDGGNEHVERVEGFEWYITDNFFTHESITKILKDISDTADALATGRANEYTAELKIKRGLFANEIIYARDLTDEQVREYNANRPKEDNTEAELIIDFYNRFNYRMEYMMKVGKEKGYDLISFMGP